MNVPEKQNWLRPQNIFFLFNLHRWIFPLYALTETATIFYNEKKRSLKLVEFVENDVNWQARRAKKNEEFIRRYNNLKMRSLFSFVLAPVRQAASDVVQSIY